MMKFLSKIYGNENFGRVCMISILICILYIPMLPAVSHGGSGNQKILMLNSYGFDMQWTRSISMVMAEVFNGYSNVDLYVEFMDTKRYPGQDNYDDLTRLYRKKYGHMKFDVIITSDDNASRFALDNRPDLFPGVPIVFCGVNNVDFPARDDFHNITGDLGVPGFRETIVTALKLFPSTKKVYFINESSTSGKADRAAIDSVLESFSDRFRSEWIEDRSEDEITEFLQNLSGDSIIMLLSYFGDKGHRYLSISEGAQFICRTSRMPVFSMWEYFLGHGIIGGQLTSGKYQAENAARLVLEILSGKPVRDIPPISTSANRYMFDNNVLKKFSINPDELPLDSIIINESVSIFVKYRKQIMALAFLISVMMILIVFLMISNRMQKITEQKLSKSEERFRFAMEATMDGLWDWDIESGRVYYSPGYISMLGYTGDEFRKNISSWEDLVHEDDRDMAFKNNNDCIENLSEKFETEFRMLGRDGKWRWILGRGSAVARDSSGRATRMIGTHTDITQRKLSEESLRSSHKRFLTVLDSIDSSIYVSDIETYEVLFMNKKMIAGYGGDMTGKRCWESIRREKGPCFNCSNTILLENGEFNQDVYTWQSKDSETGKYYINHDRIIEWIDGRQVKLQIATDITEIKKMEAKLYQSYKMEAIGNLAGGIAHDFNNILAAILGYTEIAKIHSSDDLKMARTLNKIMQAGNRAKDLIKQILTFSRQDESENITLNPASVLQQTLSILRPSIPATIEIDTDFAAETGPIAADPTKIHQILMNLCTNAFHAMEQTGGKIDILLREVNLGPGDLEDGSEVEPGRFIKLSVCDSGPGIPPEALDKVFDPYFTTKETGKGTGMGLSIVHGIVKNYGGHIHIETEPGRGAAFHVLLPVTDKDDKAFEVPADDRIARGDESILLVDDEILLTEMNRELLQQAGYKVAAESSGRAALELFKENPMGFDIVITDQTMPGMTGTDLAMEMFKIRADIPVILCTGYSSIISEEKAISLGIAGFMRKPFLIKDMAVLIRRILS